MIFLVLTPMWTEKYFELWRWPMYEYYFYTVRSSDKLISFNQLKCLTIVVRWPTLTNEYIASIFENQPYKDVLLFLRINSTRKPVFWLSVYSNLDSKIAAEIRTRKSQWEKIDRLAILVFIHTESIGLINKLLCRWFRFAQLAKGKKFRP